MFIIRVFQVIPLIKTYDMNQIVKNIILSTILSLTSMLPTHSNTIGDHCSYLCNIMTSDGHAFNIHFNSSETSSVKGKTYARYSLWSSRYELSGASDFLYREEDGRIFRYDPQTDSDLLMFDFSLSKGDTFTDISGRKYAVEYVRDTVVVQIHNKKEIGVFKKFVLRGIEDCTLYDEWLDGFGSLFTGILHDSDLNGVLCEGLELVGVRYCLYALTPSFLLFHPSESNALKTAGTGNCLIMDRGPEIQYISDMGFEFVEDKLHIIGTIQIANDPGQSYVFFICSLLNNEIDVDMSGQYGGAASWSLKNMNVSVYIPGFSPGIYTLRYGEGENNEIQLVCHGTTYIWNTDCDLQNSTVYDLSGRRLACPPEHGVYIQGGRVRVR